MKAIVCLKYGLPDGIRVEDIEKPFPTENQILVKVMAASVNPIDLQIKGGFFRVFNGLLKPKDSRLGRDIAGRVESVGSRITRFLPGDEVFGVGLGGFAEYALTREQNLALKPANCTFEEAATVPVAGITALQ